MRLLLILATVFAFNLANAQSEVTDDNDPNLLFFTEMHIGYFKDAKACRFQVLATSGKWSAVQAKFDCDSKPQMVVHNFLNSEPSDHQVLVYRIKRKIMNNYLNDHKIINCQVDSDYGHKSARNGNNVTTVTDTCETERK